MKIRLSSLAHAQGVNFCLTAMLITLLNQCSPIWADSLTVEVFTDSRHFTPPAVPKGLAINLSTYDLAVPDRLTDTLSSGLPNDPVAAEAIAAQRINANPTLEEQLKAAWQGHGLALDYGINRVPAWVFNGQAVVYGDIPLSQALGHYQRWQQGQTP